MTVEERLEEVPKLTKEIQAKTEAIYHNRSLAVKTTANISPVCTNFTGVNPHKLESAIEKVLSLEEELIESLSKLTDTRRWAIDLIDQLGDSNDRTILFERFINGKGWKVIAKDMDISETKIYQIRENAFRELERIEKVKKSKME